ncbi:dTDP-4-dehydrorhamnose reductase [Bdellovibrio sp. HCB185ZH]|uniref:dTDP-4-dehydrorhamnose reductase n=1 Tax=Bdellovibrio sp. HCB185ZH TaxID=3394235 RepID=UPI0039A6F375
MKTLIFGKSGQVAWELQRTCAVRGALLSVGSHEVDFSNPDSIVRTIRDYSPSHIINAAAYTAVDKAETNREIADQINGYAVGIIAEEAKKLGAKFVHYSTDYVFDGTKSTAYVESDAASPINNYGKSKSLGERLIAQCCGEYVILRVSWVYGARGANFLKTMVRLGAERESLSVVDDQVGSPTWCRDIAEATAQIIADRDFANKIGLYHLSAQGNVSWFGFATEIFKQYRLKFGDDALKIRNLERIVSSQYPTPAERPKNSVMNSEKINNVFGIQLPQWNESLTKVIESV